MKKILFLLSLLVILSPVLASAGTITSATLDPATDTNASANAWKAGTNKTISWSNTDSGGVYFYFCLPTATMADIKNTSKCGTGPTTAIASAPTTGNSLYPFGVGGRAFEPTSMPYKYIDRTTHKAKWLVCNTAGSSCAETAPFTVWNDAYPVPSDVTATSVTAPATWQAGTNGTVTWDTTKFTTTVKLELCPSLTEVNCTMFKDSVANSGSVTLPMLNLNYSTTFFIRVRGSASNTGGMFSNSVSVTAAAPITATTVTVPSPWQINVPNIITWNSGSFPSINVDVIFCSYGDDGSIFCDTKASNIAGSAGSYTLSASVEVGHSYLIKVRKTGDSNYVGNGEAYFSISAPSVATLTSATMLTNPWVGSTTNAIGIRGENLSNGMGLKLNICGGDRPVGSTSCYPTPVFASSTIDCLDSTRCTITTTLIGPYLNTNSTFRSYFTAIAQDEPYFETGLRVCLGPDVSPDYCRLAKFNFAPLGTNTDLLDTVSGQGCTENECTCVNDHAARCGAPMLPGTGCSRCPADPAVAVTSMSSRMLSAVGSLFDSIINLFR